MTFMKEKRVVIFTLIAMMVISVIAGAIYYSITDSKYPFTVSQAPGPILNDTILSPGSINDVKMIINFGKGKSYEALTDIEKDEKTPLGLLRSSRFGIKREMKFDKFYAEELIVVDNNNNLQSIGDYKNDSSHKWTSYVNGIAITNPSNYTFKAEDLVEWVYEDK